MNIDPETAEVEISVEKAAIILRLRRGADIDRRAARERIFDEALRREGLGHRRGAVPVAKLRNAFTAMNAELLQSQSTDEERAQFVAAVAEAIDEAPELTTTARNTLHDVLQSSFDGLRRDTTARTVICNFLGRVSFSARN